MTAKLTPLTPIDAAARLNAGQAILVDVREPAEFAAGHIGYAVSAPLAQTREILGTKGGDNVNF